jgi:hypothetical protein
MSDYQLPPGWAVLDEDNTLELTDGPSYHQTKLVPTNAELDDPNYKPNGLVVRCNTHIPHVLAIRLADDNCLEVVVSPDENGETLHSDAYPYGWLKTLLAPDVFNQFVDSGYVTFWPDTDTEENQKAQGMPLPDDITGTLRLPLKEGGYVYVNLGKPSKKTSSFTPLSGGLWELTPEGLTCITPLTMARLTWPDGSGHIVALDERGAVKAYPAEFLAWARGINAVPWAGYEILESTWALNFAPKKDEATNE